MVGRAGRLGFDKQADSVLIAPNKSIGEQIVTQELQEIKSSLHNKTIGLPRAILEAIGTKLSSDDH